MSEYVGRRPVYECDPKIVPDARDRAIYESLFGADGTRADPSNPNVVEAIEWPWIVTYRVAA
jgi:hypothetical protein